MRKIGEHAVVLGASMAGLLAARAVSEAYRHVTVVDRDALPEVGADRRGVPQGRHVHALQAGGSKILEMLFPGFLSDLAASGVPVLRDLSEAHFNFGGHLLCQQRHRLAGVAYLSSRAHLEHHVRERVRALPNVEIAQRCEVTGLLTSGGRDRVTGARVLCDPGAGAEQTVEADLVVDATGRGGRMATWLPELGYPPPAEERFALDIKYLSRRLRLTPGTLGPTRMVLIGAVPGRPTTLALIEQEDNWWLLTVAGYGGHHPPADAQGSLAFAGTVAPADVLAAIRDAEPLGEPVTHRFPASLRRGYERMPRFPAGLLAFGDAICSFNPTYGQGMSIAALQAVVLRDCLADGAEDLARRFFRAAAKPVDVAWRLSLGGDLALPEVRGHRPPAVRATNAYLDRLLGAAEADPAVAELFLKVLGFLEPPGRLFRPGVLGRVLVGGHRGHAAAPHSRPPSSAQVPRR
jgi:2-polyprenyl-6-methoxyphenol hydroxylase-like FAD-dependent oxidoreductase